MFARNKLELFCTEPFTKAAGDGDKNNEDVKTGDLQSKFKKHATHELCFVYSTKSIEHSLAYSAAMNCFERQTDLNVNPMDSELIHAVELKTCKRPSKRWQIDNFNRCKTLKWWSQRYVCVL